MRRLPLVVLVALGLAVIAACAPAAPSDGPAATVAQALDRLQAKDLDGLRALACEGQEDAIRDVLDLPAAVGTELLPGLDVDALIAAVQVDVSGLTTGEPAIEGDVAQVPITGDLKVTFDAAALKPVLKPALEANGTPMTDEELDSLLASLEAYGQSIPVEQTVRLEREDGTWKVCQRTVDGSG